MPTNNLQSLNSATSDRLQSCNRPLLIQYGYLGSGDIPKSVEVQAWGNADGVWRAIGTPLIKGRDVESPINNPVFTFDFSDVCSRHLRSGFYGDIFTQATDVPYLLKNNSTSSSDYMSLSTFNFHAVAWYENDNGVLVKSEDTSVRNPISPSNQIVGNFMLKDSNVISDKFSNMDFVAPWNFDSYNSSSTISRSFMSNCPSSVVRKISINQPLVLNILQNKMSTHDLTVAYTNNSGAPSTHVISSTTIAQNIDWYSWNVTPSNTYLFSILNDLDMAGIKNDISFYMRGNSFESKKLNFEVVDANINTNKSRKDTVPIYWINDQDALDFYNFDGGLEIQHNNKKTSYAKSGKSFTDRASSRHGIARGTTVETYTVHSTQTNRVTAEWLAEIFRSKEVYMYSFVEKKLLPISVVDGNVNLLSFNKKDSRISVKFVKEVYTIKG